MTRIRSVTISTCSFLSTTTLVEEWASIIESKAVSQEGQHTFQMTTMQLIRHSVPSKILMKKMIDNARKRN